MNHMKYTNCMNYRNDFYMNNKRIKIIKFQIYVRDVRKKVEGRVST